MALRTVEEQLERILLLAKPLPPAHVPLHDAHGRILAEPIRARDDMPGFDNSAVDGFAVRSADVANATRETPVTLEVVADIPAGSALDPRLEPGQTARIMTGSAVPTAADAVVPIEHTLEYERGDVWRATSLDEAHGGGRNAVVTVTIVGSADAGDNVRSRGSDLRAGELVLDVGSLGFGRPLTPAAVAAAAGAGHASLLVHARPRVAVVSTGSELVEASGFPERGQIRESNSHLLRGLALTAGAEVVRVATVRDDEAALRAEIESAREAGANVIVLSGGVSVGAYDVVRAVLEGVGSIELTAVAMQPGKPQAFGELDDGTLVFGLPGNPVSVAVSFEVFVRPALRALAGLDAGVSGPRPTAVVTTPWRTPPHRRQYMPVVFDAAGAIEPVPAHFAGDGQALPSGDVGAAPTDSAPSAPGELRIRPASKGGSKSHLVGGLAAAQAFAIVPADVAEVRAGDVLEIMLAP